MTSLDRVVCWRDTERLELPGSSSVNTIKLHSKSACKIALSIFRSNLEVDEIQAQILS
jgi:hypothetical protein